MLDPTKHSVVCLDENQNSNYTRDDGNKSVGQLGFKILISLCSFP